MLSKLSNTYKGLACVAVGFFLLLYTLGIIEKGINIILILVAIALMLYGVMISGYYSKIQSLINRYKK